MRILTPYIHGIELNCLTIECTSYFQVPHFRIIGLPNSEIDESRERIRAAFQAEAFEFPRRHVVVNLSPAHLPKSGTGLDLAIALQVLASHASNATMRTVGAWGELSLNGTIKASRCIPRVLEAFRTLAENEMPDLLLLGPEDFQEATTWISRFSDIPTLQRLGSKLRCVHSLGEAFRQSTDATLPTVPPEIHASSPIEEKKITTELRLHPSVHHAVLTALVGHHHIMFLGPKGTGKSFAIQAMQDMLPNMDRMMQWKSYVRSAMSDSKNQMQKRPPWIREVHPSIRPAGLLGQIHSRGYRLGELALADGGIFVADEFAEWPRDSRECLRGPLENGSIVLSRAIQSTRISTRFLFVATSNLCGCGGLPRTFVRSSHVGCTCSASQQQQYWARLSGPILDRMDIVHMILPTDRPSPRSLSNNLEHGSIPEQIQTCQSQLKSKWGELPGLWDAETTERNYGALQPDQNVEHLLRRGSLRSRHKCIRLAATLAALDQKTIPEASHWARAWSYRLEGWQDSK